MAKQNTQFRERPTPTSISLLPSKIYFLEQYAYQNSDKYNSRNHLIDTILTKWIEENKGAIDVQEA